MAVVLLLAGVSLAQAQVTVGDNVSLDLNALVQAGYTADYGNFVNSDHGFTFGGAANLGGYYYSPGFLSFTVSPYYNQSRANSASQSLTDSSGVSASANIFSGSNYPGSISYNKSYNSSGIFGLPGLPELHHQWKWRCLEHRMGDQPAGSSQSFLQFPGGSHRLLHLRREFRQHFGFSFLQRPRLLPGCRFQPEWRLRELGHQVAVSADFHQPADRDSGFEQQLFNFGASHKLPWYGVFTANYNHSYFNSDYADTNYSGAVDVVNAAATFHPIDRLDVGLSSNYTNNLLGALYQNIITSGGVLQQNTPGTTSTSFDVDGYGSYKVTEHIFALGNVDYREQSYLGSSFNGTTVTGSVTYWKHLLGGTFSSVFSISRSDNNTTSQATTGLVALANYSRQIGGWSVTGAANYSQNAQTALISYTTSGFGYSGSIGHRLGRYNWNANVGGSQSVLNLPGYGNSNQFYLHRPYRKVSRLQCELYEKQWQLAAGGHRPGSHAVAAGHPSHGPGFLWRARVWVRTGKQSHSPALTDRQLFPLVQQYAEWNDGVGEYQRKHQRSDYL